MNKIVLAILVTVLGIVMWLALTAKYKARGFGLYLLGNWRKDPRIREATIFSLILMVSLVIFAIFPRL